MGRFEIGALTSIPVARTGMECSGIAPIGLPAGWPVLVDAAVVEEPVIVIGFGVSASKLLLAGSTARRLPGVDVVPGLGRPID